MKIPFKDFASEIFWWFLRQRFRVFCTLKILVRHHHSALLSLPSAAIDLKLRHRLTEEVDNCTLKMNQLSVTIWRHQFTRTHRIIEFTLQLLNERYDLLIAARICVLVSGVSNAEVIAVKRWELRVRHWRLIRRRCCLPTDLAESFAPLVQKLCRFQVVNSRMLSLQCGQPILDSVAKEVSKVLKLQRCPSEVLEQQLLKSCSRFVFFDVSLELCNRISRKV